MATSKLTGVYELLWGGFECTSGRLRVSDPCYEKDLWCSNLLHVCRTGTWGAAVKTGVCWGGKRVFSLLAYHSEVSTKMDELEWEAEPWVVGVDSGQAGVFDDARYPDGESTGEYGEEDTFYGQCCEITLERLAGVVEGCGVVSSTGIGDGFYDCWVVRSQGVVVAVRIDFLDDSEDEGGACAPSTT